MNWYLYWYYALHSSLLIQKPEHVDPKITTSAIFGVILSFAIIGLILIIPLDIIESVFLKTPLPMVIIGLSIIIFNYIFFGSQKKHMIRYKQYKKNHSKSKDWFFYILSILIVCFYFAVIIIYRNKPLI